MTSYSRRVWLVTIAAVVLFVAYETVKALLLPNLSMLGSHALTVIVAGVTVFVVARYALARHDVAMDEINRKAESTEHTNRLLSGVLAAMREGVVIADADCRIVLYNDAAGRIVKVPREKQRNSRLVESGSRAPYRLVDATRDPAINDAFRRVIGTRQAIEARINLSDREASYLLQVAPLGKDRVVGVFFEITELERLERVRREFFDNLSHELRTPLTAILAYAETLLTGGIEDAENRARFIERLHKHALRMSDLIRDISDLSAIESGRIKLALAPVRLRSVVNDVTALVEARQGVPDIAVSAAIPDSLFVLADHTRLEQILLNLIENAVKFNRPGGSVTISADRLGDKALVRIEDTGIGIPASDLPRVFERLYRVDKSRSRRIDGTGLGLAIVKHLVQAHAGEVSVTSEPGRGSAFSFTIPLAQQRSESGLAAAG